MTTHEDEITRKQLVIPPTFTNKYSYSNLEPITLQQDSTHLYSIWCWLNFKRTALGIVLELISLDYMVHKSNGNLYLGNILYLETETREEVIQKERLNFFFFFLISERLNL
jgi:hypothetical protein